MNPVKGSLSLASMAKTMRCVDDDGAGNTDTELWLVQVPQGFDVSALNKLDSSMFGESGGTQTLKIKTEQEKKEYYSVAAFRDSADCRKMTAVVCHPSGEMTLGGEVSNMLMVAETSAHSARHADGIVVAPKKPVPMPVGLKVRYTPFGAGTPCPSVSGQMKKKKKRASKGENSAEEDAKKSSKKRKREASPDGEEPSPKKKKKKSKHKLSESMEHQNGDAGNADRTVSRKSKHKSRKSEGTAGNSVVDGQLFVIDKVGAVITDSGLENDQPQKGTKHKKSKKEKKHRKTL